MEWNNINELQTQDHKEIVICYRDDDTSYWESTVINCDNLNKCDWGEIYWMSLPNLPKEDNE